MRWDQARTKPWLRHARNFLRGMKTWQLLVILLMATLAAATFLRLNNIGMDNRRQVVINADKNADQIALKASLLDLQYYVSHHMNASLGSGFYLSEAYHRDTDAVLSAAATTSNPNSAEYQKASLECRSTFVGGVASFRNDYVQCVVQKVSALTGQSNPTGNINLPKAAAYRVNYASPLWSPDIAGFLVLFWLVVLVIIIGRLVALLVLRLLIKHHYRSV